MTPSITIEMHDMANKIEEEPLPLYLVEAVVNPDTGVILQYKDVIQSKNKNTRDLWENGLSK